ncbi:unnamed protein product [Cylindrotheca closterium]|uniref:Actin-like ATPase domain-containing protein n=1 Tax=Cylindrotheca closterium TaxID=2856 RepID=A0AAD2CJ66_9STRA|nr:unnamed protein product [Cylindrotheca closterium]
MSSNQTAAAAAAAAATPTKVAIGIDLGSWNARLASYDEALQHPVMIANHDGHRTTRCLLAAAPGSQPNAATTPVTIETVEKFVQDNLMQLAASSAHTKNLNVILSIPADKDEATLQEEGWMAILQKFGAVITDAAATCLAYEDCLQKKDGQRILVLDGGARGIKATLLECMGNASGNGTDKNELPVLSRIAPTKRLQEVNGNLLIDTLAQSVAQQFEQKNRFPRGEVWESKKVKEKLRRACESGLKTLVINNTVTIHVDGLYEGVDCQVSISKPKWDHLSSKLATQAKKFLKELPEADYVLLAGNMHPWLTPHAKAIFQKKLITSSSFDPAEAAALGCAKQAFLNMTAEEDSDKAPTMKVSVSPVSIGIKAIIKKAAADGGENKSTDEELTMIRKGTPLPALVSRDFAGTVSMDLWQLQPQEKQLATFAELEESTTLKLHLNEQGKLRIWVNDQTLTIG